MLRLATRIAPRATTAFAPAFRTMATSRFTPAHEYASIDGNIATIGVTDFAQAALGDVVYVDLPGVGDEFEAGESFGSVESVKAASDVYAPVGGTVIAVNEVLEDEPGTINTSPEVEGWFIKLEMTDASEAEKLMDEKAYKAHCEAEAH